MTILALLLLLVSQLLLLLALLVEYLGGYTALCSALHLGCEARQIWRAFALVR